MLTKYGRREWLGSAFPAVLLILLGAYLVSQGSSVGGYALIAFSLFAWLCIAAFFRDPRRTINPDSASLVSPADGVIWDIELISGSAENDYFSGGDTLRIGIFLSVLDVHINRMPCDVIVKSREYREGGYNDARSPEASTANEAMTVSCSSSWGFPLLVRQISGAVAKRIVCEAGPGTEFAKGEKFGMIKFGSRTELYLPARSGFDVVVKTGDKVYAGSSVIAYVRTAAGEKVNGGEKA